MTIWDNLRRHALEEIVSNMLPEGQESLRVVGVTFTPNYPGCILALDNLLRDLNNIPLRLVRNPHNKFDSNAVEVRYGNEMLGHLSKDVAARIAPKLDNGDSHYVRVEKVLINPEKPDLPGLDIHLEWLPK